MRKAAILAALVFAAVSAPALADEVRVTTQSDAVSREVKVKVADQNVASPAGAAAIESRLRRAARVACTPDLVDRPSATAERQVRACQAEALAAARQDSGLAGRTLASAE